MANINHWGLTDGMRLARTVGRFISDRSNYTIDEFIEAAEKAAEAFPYEWVLFFTLGTKYFERGEFVRALQATKRCVQLKPRDLRSTYALATIYNTLTTSDFSSRREEYTSMVAALNPPIEAGPFDPSIALSEATEYGMVVDTAASQAIRWFEHSLSLNPDGPSKKQIIWDLDTLYRRYPHLRL